MRGYPGNTSFICGWNKWLVAAVCLSLMSCIPFVSAKAQLRIDINQGHSSPMPIALPTPANNNEESRQLGDDIMKVVSANLERSGLFRPIDKEAFIQVISSSEAIPRFTDWRQINAMALVTADVKISGSSNFSISFRLWDVYREKQVAGKEFNTFRANWRRVAHLISDEIYKRLTGEEGYFDSRLVYIAESGPLQKRVKRLAIMDQDGENHKYLTNGKNLVLTPRFSPDTQEIIYMSYAGKAPKVYLRDLQTGREELVGRFDGMSFAPRFSNDGDRVVMSIAKNGNTNLHEMNLRTRQMRQLTSEPAIETSPSYSPDGKRVVFESDRAGGQQLYVMNADGSNVQRISYGDGRYASPVWSPRGDWVAFTKMKSGMFYIGIMRPDGSGERVVDSAYLVEGPTWSPNGRVLMYTRQNRQGAPNIYSVDITGKNRRRVITPVDASDPAWSPLLPL